MIMNFNRRVPKVTMAQKAPRTGANTHTLTRDRTHAFTHTLTPTHVYYDERKPRGDPTHVRLTGL